jgi:hypothetical protein
MTVSVGLGAQVAGLTKSIFQMVGGVIYFGEVVTWLVRPRPRDAIIRIMRTRIPCHDFDSCLLLCLLQLLLLLVVPAS